MGNYFKIAMFITSFLPLWIIIVFIDIMSIIKSKNHLYTEYISLGVIAISFTVSLIIIIKSFKEIMPSSFYRCKVEDVRLESGITSEFLLSYILPLVAFDFTLWDSVIQFLIYFSILAFLCIRNNNVYANLLFECRGYKFYNCELKWTSEEDVAAIEYLVISKQNLSAQKGNIILISELNKPFCITKEVE